MKKIILHLCADTGSDSYPYSQDLNYEVIRIGSDIGVENYHPPKNVYGVFANPPCTNFSIVRNDKTAQTPRNIEEGLRLVKECQRIIKEANPTFWVIENPATGLLKKYLGQPDFVYQPWEFGSPWSKKTALWGKFNKPQKLYSKWEDVPNKIPKLYIRGTRNKPNMVYLHKSAYKLIQEFHHLPKPENDMEFRSLCSQKFAQEFYRSNQ